MVLPIFSHLPSSSSSFLVILCFGLKTHSELKAPLNQVSVLAAMQKPFTVVNQSS